MILMKKVSTLFGLMIIAIAIVVLFGGAFAYQYFALQNNKLPSDSRAVSVVSNWKAYTNNEYGFKITFPDSWKGYTIEKSSWTGHVINNYAQSYSGVELIFKNPQSTSSQAWQNIPIMVFTPNVWKMVNGDNPTVAVSAAPIGPAKIGENAKYIFATPPRWYGFTDDVGFQEAVEIVKTFKAF